MTNVANKHGEVLNCVLTAGEGTGTTQYVPRISPKVC